MNQFAKLLKVPTGRISQILAGKRADTPDTALRLAQFFGTSPEVWLNLQTQYNLSLADNKHGEEIRKQVALVQLDGNL